MTLVLWIMASFLGGMFLGLLGWGMCRFSNLKRRSGLALAVAGEIAGILRSIEIGGTEASLREIAERPTAGKAKSKPLPLFIIPKPVIIESNAAKLGILGPALAREVAQFHALLGGISGSAVLIAGDKAAARAALLQLQEVLSLADDILRHLKPFVNYRSKP